MYTDVEWEEILKKDTIEGWMFPSPTHDIWRCPVCERLYVFEEMNNVAVKSYVLEKQRLGLRLKSFFARDRVSDAPLLDSAAGAPNPALETGAATKISCKCGEALPASGSPNGNMLRAYTDEEWERFLDAEIIKTQDVPPPPRDIWRCPKCERVYVFEKGGAAPAKVYALKERI
jgi:ribosomal protein L37AE/L43A